MAHILRLATPWDASALKEIWAEVFGDPQEIIDEFFNRFYSSCESLIMEDNGFPASAAHLLPIGSFVDHEGNEHSCAACYAVATKEDYRNQGYASDVVLNSARQGLTRGLEFVTACPAREDLISFYSKKGFRVAFSVREAEYEISELAVPEDGMSAAIGAEDYSAAREIMLADRPHISFYDELISYQEYLCKFGGGELLLLKCGDARGCAAVERDGDTLIVKELLMPGIPMRDAAAIISACFEGAKRCIVRVPEDAGSDGSVKPFAMYVRTHYIPNPDDGEVPAWYGFAFD